MKQLNEQQLAARDERRLRFRTLLKKLAEMNDAERAARLEGYGFIKLSTQTPYSQVNRMLIAIQSREIKPTILGGFAEWLKQGRAVRKGEHGYMIWIPVGVKVQEVPAVDPKGELTTMLLDTSTDVRFIIGTVFDISQTEVREHPEKHPQKGA